ncbi:HdeD family acid-resistance protein [Curtobacterium sp. PhB115]|uniref:HdeD family acid-resistance protein n=1 Tax=Curtobacterium sp. PhB115 TaxID=2485173 RepID=UPI000F949741|nr:DUF308 domain-containing protein [Curtobacterium sp. PhB115]ROP65420.1 uncharacterized membrane protein HdeD (DUF308 family) [Curtobacterium sp. PhB115]
MALDNETERASDVGRRLRTPLLIVGVVAVLAGVAALVLPHATLFAVAWVFGVYLLVSGMSMVGRAFVRGTGTGRRIGLIVLGILVVIGGFVAIVHPPIGVRWVALLIGFAWLVEGIALLYAPTPAHRALTIGAAVLSILSGILVINLPALGAALAVAAVAGVLIVFGIVQIVIAIGIGRSGEAAD